MKYIIPLVIAAASTATLQAKEIRFKDCPAAVKKAINARLAGGTIDDIDRVVIKGKTRFIVDIDGPGNRDVTYRLSVKGKEHLKTEDISFNAAPAVIRSAINGQLRPGWRIDDIDRVTQNKVTTFVVEIDRNNAPDLKLTFSASGKVLKTVVERYDD